MALSSVDSIVAAITAGQTYRHPFFREIRTGATSVAGRWHECMTGIGSGGAMTLTGTAGLGTALQGSTAGGIPQPTQDVDPAVKRLLSMSMFATAATAVPGFVMLTDLLYMYPSCVVTGTPSTLSNAAAKPTRFNSGVGVQASCIVATAIGAAQPALTMTYTDSGGTGSNTGNFKASANSLPIGSLFTGGTLAALGSPVMNLQTGDAGVASIDSYTLASGTTGTVTFMLHRPIATIPIIGANIAGERDFLFQMPTLPKIDDDACLGLFVLVGGALVASQLLYGEITTVWG